MRPVEDNVVMNQTLRIATWNVERLRHKNKLEEILSRCLAAKADILVLTETDERVRPEYEYCYSTAILKGTQTPVIYGDTENRVSIFTNYKCVRQYKTYDDKTSICVELETSIGNLIVYGTIIGISGNRRIDYNEDLAKQLEDIRMLAEEDKNICMIGDYNCSFGDNFYYTKAGRNAMLNCFQNYHISILTADRAECIDHIAVSDSFMKGVSVKSIEEWNTDMSLSDHKGIVVAISSDKI